ncbi:MAG: type II toxin-antitoxin system Phd/YefM family antitoxin [Eubacteriaceae bacterium]
MTKRTIYCTINCTKMKGYDLMLAVNYSTIRNNLKNYCDKTTDEDEVVIITRKEEKNVVLLSLEKYNQLMKAARNAEYLAMIDRGLEQLASGNGQQHELIEIDE